MTKLKAPLVNGDTAGVQELDAADLEGQAVIALSPDVWEKVQKIAAERNIPVSQAISEAISLELTVLEQGGTSPEVHVKRKDGSGLVVLK